MGATVSLPPLMAVDQDGEREVSNVKRLRI